MPTHGQQRAVASVTKLSLVLLILSFITYGLVSFKVLYSIDQSLETASQNTFLTNFKKGTFSDAKVVPSIYKHEANVFRNLLERTKSVTDECKSSLTNSSGPSAAKKPEAGEKMLPERGVQAVLERWLNTHDYGKEREYPICTLPPPKSCNVTSYSVIIMSHTVQDTHRLQKLFGGIQSLAYRPGTAEIILVWNSERELLHNSTHRMAQKLLYHANDASHPLRIFYSLENGLQNNLLNRYNPIIKPTQELIMYFDDDGPFFSDEAMTSGVNLWRFNSDTQVGSFPRNLRLSSDRMKLLQKKASELAVTQAEEDAWQTHVSPNDRAGVDLYRNGGALDGGFPKFIPLCHGETGDTVDYNYNHFPDFEAHMFLPSGTLLHRNFLCFIWHPVFADLRQFILDHPTHPDDMVISTLVSHLSGKGLRSFTRRFSSQKNKKALSPEKKRELGEGRPVDQSQRRRLLWQQDNWGDKREDAINLIVNYFGSINPGSIGWCTGTQYLTKGTDSLYECNPLFPTQKEIPWMNEGGLGNNQCP